MSEKSRRLNLTLLAATDGCALLRAAGELVDNGHLYLVLDLTALTFCDSRGLNCLLALDWLCRRLDGRLILASLGNRLHQLLEQTKVSDRFLVRSTVGAALESVPMEHRPQWPPASDDRAHEPADTGRRPLPGRPTA